MTGSVHGPPRAYSFFDLKGDVEQALEPFAYSSLAYDDQAAVEWLHPGRSARAVMDGATVARFGQLHPQMAGARKLRQEILVAEVFLDRLYQHRLHEPRYARIPRFPAVERDFSFTFDNGVKWADVQRAVSGLKIAELRNLRPVEIFRGGAVAAGRYSLLLRARFQSEERTLRDDEVNDWSQRIIAALQKLGGRLRS
jgi:phenylalanyl-tRNA synthetase beta chain